MDTRWLREHAIHWQAHLAHFQQIQQQLDKHYRQSLQHIQDLAAKSALMECYCIHQDRQQRAIQDVTQLDTNER